VVSQVFLQVRGRKNSHCYGAKTIPLEAKSTKDFMCKIVARRRRKAIVTRKNATGKIIGSRPNTAVQNGAVQTRGTEFSVNFRATGK